ncbi:KN motif and ankyrin repeat domain-containing protein 4 isoform X2 [Copidosoma floridanum]|nr:KN motif and ankyrin repeat domain-containing protein 4 isoform X2 [Copidosoma floridanum]
MREKLAALFNVVKEVDVLNSNDEANLSVLQRPELGITFTKLHCWRLLQYEKCVFIDADALVVRNCDELFEREELSAAPDVGWPDCFNSGVFVFKPSLETFAAIVTFAVSQGSFDGADQGLLNMYFSDWAHKDISKHLPFIYNMCSTATYSYAPAFKQFAANVRIIHFIGNTKPWLQYFDTMTGIVQVPPGCDHLQPLMQMWWNIFCENVHPQLSDVMGGLAGALSRLTMGEARTEEQRAVEDHVRKQNWEQGQIDFMGRDSFDNILRKINETLASAPPRQQSPAKETRQPKKSSRKSSEMETAVEEGEATLPVLDTEDESKTILAPEITEDARQRISESISYPTNTDKELAERLSTIIASEVDETSNEKISTMDKSVYESLEKLVPTLKSIDTSETTMQEGLMEPQVILDVKQTEKQSEVSPAITTETFEGPLPTTQEKKTQIVSEATTECPVPIQVAESVLQAQPKETVSEDAIPVTEAIASSIIPSVQESAVSVSEAEAVIQPDECALSDKVILSQPSNDNDTFLEPREEKTLTSSEVNGVLAAHDLGNETPNLKTTLTEQKESQSHVGTVELGTTPLDCASPNEEVPSLQKLELKIDLQSTKTIGEEGETQVLEEEQKPALESEILSEIGSTTGDSLVETNVEPPVRPSRSKDLKIPDTPIIIGPTPPTSPPLDTDAIVALEESSQKQIQPETVDLSTDSESQLKESASFTDVQEQNRGGSEQVQVESVQLPEKGETEKKSKKIAKKSSAESDTRSSPESEGSGKKIVKKVVKKVSKKTKEGTEDDEGGSGHKLKKTAKTEKKLTKTASTSLEADTDVPETPPPPSSSTEPPVPPKRKSKVSSSIKKTDKKSDQ